MAQNPLAPPPPSGKPETDKWLWLLWRRLTQAGQILWSSLDFSGSNLTDLATRNHADLQNLNTTSYTHLTSTQATDLTDGGATTLHKHDHAAQDNLNSTDYSHLTAAQVTDLTDAGDSTLHYHAADRARANHTGTQSGDTVTLPVLQTPTHDSVTDLFHLNSSGLHLSASPTMITATGTQIAVLAGEGIINDSATGEGENYWCEWSALPLTTVTDARATWVCVDYNAGNPTIVLLEGSSSTDFTEPAAINYFSCWPLGYVVREGSTVHVTNNPRKVSDAVGGLIRRFRQTLPLARDELAGGLLIGETGTRNITLTAGYLFDRQNRFTIPAIDTSVSGSFDRYYGTTLGAAGATQWPNTHYNNAGVLTEMTINRYANLFWYLELDGNLVMVYGNAQYATAAAASAESIPSTLPLRVNVSARLIARTTFQKSAATFTSNDSAFTNTFTASAVTTHNNLSGIQGGAAAEYYHLTGAQATDLTDGGESTAHYHDADRARANHTGTQTAATISDFDTEVSNNTDVAANTSARHAAVTVADSTSIDLTLTGQQISAAAIFGTTAGTVAEGNHAHATLYQPLDTFLIAIAALGTAADKIIYTTGVDTAAETAITAYARSILDDADEATFKATVNLETGVDVQAYDADLTAIAALTLTANQVLGKDAAGTGWEGKTLTAGTGVTVTHGAGTVTIAATGGVTSDIYAFAAAQG